MLMLLLLRDQTSYPRFQTLESCLFLDLHLVEVLELISFIVITLCLQIYLCTSLT